MAENHQPGRIRPVSGPISPVVQTRTSYVQEKYANRGHVALALIGTRAALREDAL